MSARKNTARLVKAASGRWELLVDGEPFLILGAELQNSSMSSAAYMDTVWQELKDMGINTILGAVTWETIEPLEGQFTFSELDAVIGGAEVHGLKLGLLWFGSYKNAKSSYVPGWVKKDVKRFPRMYVKNPDGPRLKNSNTLSVFSSECLNADAMAFSRLMQHVNEYDKARTVILVQVENEVGLQGDSRDRSTVANELFEGPVPRELFDLLTTQWNTLHPDLKRNFSHLAQDRGQQDADKPGNWESCFGKSIWTDELFMSYYYAKYLDHITAVGKRELDVPMFTNSWLPSPGQGGTAWGGGIPGTYPSGGPSSSVIDVWIEFAPHIDFLSPDIYHNYYSLTCADYTHKGRALFIPEQRRDDFGGRTAWIAIAEHHALGVSPFGIDTQTAREAAFTDHYKLLASVSSHILSARRNGRKIFGFAFHELDDKDEPSPPEYVRETEHYTLSITRANSIGKLPPGFGLIIEVEPQKFLLIGKGFKVSWKSKAAGQSVTEILRFEEKSVVDPKTQELRTERVLNGDESSSGSVANMPVDFPDHGTCPVAVVIPARTAIAVAEVFTIHEEDDS